MADGEVISAGSPAHVRNDPAVVEAYLGGSITAIERSTSAGSAPPKAPAPAPAAASLADVVPGLGPARETALLDAFGSRDNIRDAQVEDLVAVRGIGPGLAARINTTLSATSDRSERSLS
jgi:hypothetical protein